VVTLFLEGCP